MTNDTEPLPPSTAESRLKAPRTVTRAERLALTAAALLGVLAAFWYYVPVNVPAGNDAMYGCGSAGVPSNGPFHEWLCDDLLARRALLALCVLVGALLVALGAVLVEAVSGRGRPKPAAGQLWSIVAGLLVVDAAVYAALRPLGHALADARFFRCGSGFRPPAGDFARGLCGDVPDAARWTAIALLGAAAIVAIGGWYAFAAQPGQLSAADPPGD